MISIQLYISDFFIYHMKASFTDQSPFFFDVTVKIDRMIFWEDLCREHYRPSLSPWFGLGCCLIHGAHIQINDDDDDGEIF